MFEAIKPGEFRGHSEVILGEFKGNSDGKKGIQIKRQKIVTRFKGVLPSRSDTEFPYYKIIKVQTTLPPAAGAWACTRSEPSV